MNKKTAYIMVAAAAVMWGLTGFFSINLSAMGFTPTEMSMIRSFISVILVGVIFFIQDRNVFKIHSLKDFALMAFTGFFGYVLFIVVYIIAVNQTSMAVACVLLYTFPAFIIIFSAILYKEKVTAKKIIVLVLVFAGCVMVSGLFDGEVKNFTGLGIFCGIISGISFALYSMGGKEIMKKYSSETVLLYMFIMASAFFILTGKPAETIEKTTNLGAWPMMIGFALFISVIPYLIYLKGLKAINAGEAGIIASIEPVVSTVAGVLLFDESLNLIKVCGIAVVLAAITYMNYPERKAEKTDEDKAL